MWKATVALFFLIFQTGGAFACRMDAGNDQKEAGWSKAVDVFVGRVVEADGKWIVFKVEKGFKGVAKEGGDYKAPQGSSSCDIRVGKGDRWLWAGGSLFSSSVRLGGAYEMEKVKVPAKMPSKFGSCSRRDSCTWVYHGCSGRTAVSADGDNEAAASSWLWKNAGGDPREISCETSSHPRGHALPAVCEQGVCEGYLLKTAK